MKEFMAILCFYTIAAFGAAYLVGHSVISRPFRRVIFETGGPLARLFVEMLECPMCFGFWTGLITGIVAFLLLPDAPVFTPLALGFYTTGSNLIISRATGLTPEDF